MGWGFLSSITLAFMMMPFMQKPHCAACSSIKACLQHVRMLDAPQPFERGDVLALHCGHRDAARAHRRAVHDHGAGAALRQSAAKPRPIQLQIVSQDVQQRSRRVGIDRSWDFPLTLSVIEGIADPPLTGAPSPL